MVECLFCKIAAGEISSDIVDQDEEIVAFRDINPKAPTHILIIPRQHIESIAHVSDEQAALIGKLFCKARDLARREGIEDSGYRLVFNVGRGAGQEVFHVHLHLLGGRSFTWPPG